MLGSHGLLRKCVSETETHQIMPSTAVAEENLGSCIKTQAKEACSKVFIEENIVLKKEKWLAKMLNFFQ